MNQMNAKTPLDRKPRRAMLIALTCSLTLAIAATGYGAVTIYDNDFKSRSEFKTVRKAAGGKACDRTWHKRKALGIKVKQKRKTTCAYEVPVYADRSGANMTVKAVFKVSSEDTTSKVRRGAFGLLAMRASNSARYQLRVFPKSGRWELRRGPASNEFPAKGKLKKAAGLDKRNKIVMQLSGDRINAWVNGKRVIKDKVDGSSAQVDGTATRVGIGQKNKAERPTTGFINLVRLDLPDP